MNASKCRFGLGRKKTMLIKTKQTTTKKQAQSDVQHHPKHISIFQRISKLFYLHIHVFSRL
jgi:hypothetical protein